MDIVDLKLFCDSIIATGAFHTGEISIIESHHYRKYALFHLPKEDSEDSRRRARNLLSFLEKNK